MPGTTIHYSKKKISTDSNKKLKRSLQSLLFYKNYSESILIDNDNLFAAFTGYSEYPTYTIEIGKYVFFIEGKLYNKPQEKLKEELELLANLIFKETDRKKLTDWLVSIDGEFIITIYDRNEERIAVLNDSLGRLPLYSYRDGDQLILTREISFIINLSLPIKMDSIGVAQFLFFGFPLDTRTLYDKIERVEAGALFIIDSRQDITSKEILYIYNFDQNFDVLPPMKEVLSNLEELFLSACKNRTEDGYKNLLSLSGGLDSRAVLAGLEKAKIPYLSYTFIREDSSNRNDVEVAEYLANIYNMNWALINLVDENTEDISFLLKSKAGMNELGYNFMIQFLREVFKKEGSKLIYFTGDGGHQVIPSQSPPVRLGSLKKMVDYIISSRSSLFKLSDIIAFTGVSYSDFYDELYNVLENYPEKKSDNKFIHYQLFGRCFKWLYEGEDRNRYWYWSVSPFYAQPFFNYSMMLPDTIKKNYGLQRKFLLHLSEKSANVKNAFWNLPITSSKLKYIILVKDGIYPRLPVSIKRVINRYFNKIKINKAFQEDINPYLNELLNDRESLFNNLNLNNLKKMKNISTFETEHIITLLKILINLKTRNKEEL